MNATVQGNVKPPPSPRISKPRVSLRVDTSLSATRPSLPRTPSQTKHKSPKTPRTPGTPRTPTTPKTSKELIDDMTEQIKDGNYMKALQRKFSLLNLDDKNKAVREKLIDYFNSPIGLINRAKAD